MKITAYVLFGIAAAFTVATMCFPFLHGDDDPEVVWQRTVHNKLAPVGFSVLLVQTVVVLLLSVLRNYKQFMVSAAMAALFLVSSIFLPARQTTFQARCGYPQLRRCTFCAR